MIDNRKPMSCAEFSACMADLIAAGEDIFAHPHVRRCALHRALLDELEAIATAARQLFPEVDPPDTLWEGIQARLDEEYSQTMFSDLWPGSRVVTAIRVVEDYDPSASPPSPSQSAAERAWPIYLKVQGSGRTPARRERRK
jgi:hypothetical protein